ncbi:tyrosine-type recombinase/integrase [Sphingomonas sp. ERG5]|uniref:tyrosine-type recombinase/integrase n=1 Tax=Sphingomonas sp. ERG5 TaxID=1381597 RepID=UPI00068BB8F1|nr:tyrosine-type recombinase/integrase [Sphingomonas sp. ERG5]
MKFDPRDQWSGDNGVAVHLRCRAWWTMRRWLGLPVNVIPKTIRHTIATELRRRGVPAEQISGLLGHVAMNRTTRPMQRIIRLIRAKRRPR